jgi:hypothetical protein
MDDTQIQQLAHEIANQTAFPNWGYWLTLLAVALIAALGGYFGAYFAKRGEHAANKADLDKILGQLEQTTRMTASIESVVSLGEWSERERRTLRRVKLEELMLTAHRANDWLGIERNRLIYLSDDREAASPLPLMTTLGNLFFPELQLQISALYNACVTDNASLRKVHLELLEARQRVLNAVADGAYGVVSSTWEAIVEVETGKAQFEVRARLADGLLDAHRPVVTALVELDEAASALMAEIIAVPPSS